MAGPCAWHTNTDFRRVLPLFGGIRCKGCGGRFAPRKPKASPPKHAKRRRRPKKLAATDPLLERNGNSKITALQLA
jgi:hypothetical protein